MRFNRLALAAGLFTAPMAATANDYPTLERVDAVLTCMALKGGQTIENLYSCACEIDRIAEQMTLAEYNEARTYEQYARMPAEKGALFRDSDQGALLKARIENVRAEATNACLTEAGRVKTVGRTDKTRVIEDNATAAALPAIPQD